MKKEDKEIALAKKKRDKKFFFGFTLVNSVPAVILLIIGLVLDVNENSAADAVLAFFALFFLFCVMGLVLFFIVKQEVKDLEHPELKAAREAEAKRNRKAKVNRTSFRVNPYTDEIEKDDGLSIEEIDFFESDIYDDK